MVTPLCILLVDESRFFRELEKQFLRNTPATLLLAADINDALDLAREQRPSLVFMDLHTDRGLNACRTFKADPDLRDIPLIVIGNKDADREDAIAAGANDYLQKPLDRRMFLGVGHRFLVSIDRREPRRNCHVPVAYVCRGRQLHGHCIDLSSGGMFLDCQPAAQKGETLILKFSLPDAQRTPVEINGRVAWLNTPDEVIKPDYPMGYGVEFVDISAEVGAALRRCFGTELSISY